MTQPLSLLPDWLPRAARCAAFDSRLLLCVVMAQWFTQATFLHLRRTPDATLSSVWLANLIEVQRCTLSGLALKGKGGSQNHAHRANCD